jgi:hypothetical protein
LPPQSWPADASDKSSFYPFDSRPLTTPGFLDRKEPSLAARALFILPYR